MSGVRLIEGGLHRDDRGTVRFVNAFDFAQVDRFYAISPANAGEVRGWVGHQREWKWFFAIQGTFELGVVRPDRWDAPAKNPEIARYTLSSERPAVLEVPAGHFTASIAAQPNGTLLIFSSGRMEDNATDNFRLPADYWPEFSPRR